MSGREPSETAVTANVTVVLGEWIVELTPTSAAAGELTFDMDPGSHVLFCYVTEPEDGGEVLFHFARGHATTFTVN